jgi:hypothetical protein
MEKGLGNMIDVFEYLYLVIISQVDQKVPQTYRSPCSPTAAHPSKPGHMSIIRRSYLTALATI